jgi:hypothetical protein
MTAFSPPDTATLIWERLFRCRFPHLQTLTEADIRTFGMPVTGNSIVDKSMANQWITTSICIAKMVEYHKDGVPIRVVNISDTKIIYEHITKHLQAWRLRLERGINIGDAPIDDLVAMDAFANSVYAHAKYQFTRGIAGSILMRHMSGVMKLNKTNMIKIKPEVAPSADEDGITRINSEKEEDNYPQRESLSDIFKNRAVGFRKWN